MNTISKRTSYLLRSQHSSIRKPDGMETLMKCDRCDREREKDDSYDYSPMQVITNSPFGWYNEADGSYCGDCITNMIRNQ